MRHGTGFTVGHSDEKSVNTSKRKSVQEKDTKRTYNITALFRRTERSEKARARREAFRRGWKEDRERITQENERLRRENESALRLLLHMTRRYERLRSYTETLRNWIAGRSGSRIPTG